MTPLKTAFLSALSLSVFASCTNQSEASNETSEIINSDSLALSDFLELDTVTYAPESYQSTTTEALGDELMKISSVNGIKVGMTEEQVIELIGKPHAKSEEEMWETDGALHKYWYYADSSFVLEFSDQSYDPGYKIEIIEVLGKSDFQNERGIKFDSPVDLVKERYKKAIEICEWSDGETQIQLGDATGGCLLFSICEERICGIRYGAIVRC